MFILSSCSSRAHLLQLTFSLTCQREARANLLSLQCSQGRGPATSYRSLTVTKAQEEQQAAGALSWLFRVSSQVSKGVKVRFHFQKNRISEGNQAEAWCLVAWYVVTKKARARGLVPGGRDVRSAGLSEQPCPTERRAQL